jgi:diguanylate cyclase (GGDEF)-like protein
MKRWDVANSLITRLVISFCLGGLLLSVGLTVLEYRHASHVASAAASQQMAMTARNLRDVTYPLIDAEHREALGNVLEIFNQDPRIVAIRFESATRPSIAAGQWPQDLTEADTWTFDDRGLASIGSLDLDRYTVLIAPFRVGGEQVAMKIVIDGPYLRNEVRAAAVRSTATVWLMLAVLTLVGLLLLRWWFTGPLQRITDLVARDAPAESFSHMAANTRGELGDLAEAIARMLSRIDEMTAELRQRKQALDNLYQFAPGAMLSIGPDGRVTEANRRSVGLFAAKDEDALIGTPVLDYVHPKDRGLFRQAIDRLPLDRTAKCGLAMTFEGVSHDMDLQLAGVFDDDDVLSAVRLSLVDVSETKRLLRQVTEQRHLLDLVIDHMSDAILLIGPDRRILTANARLCSMLNVHPDSVIEQTYDPVELWSPLEIVDAALFEKRMMLAAETPTANCQEQFDGATGSYRFLAIPVNDAVGETMAQLYVVQDVTAEVRNRRLLEQQDAQLRALQQMGEQLHQVGGVDDLIERTTAQLLEMMDVELVGAAVRYNDPKMRCRQIIHDGGSQMLLSTNEPVAEVIQQSLMPKVLGERETSFWPDLSQAGPWAQPLVAAGIESLAATALYSQDRTQGIIWIARRGGERIERYHIYLLETLAPMVSTSLRNAELRDQMRELALTDPTTGLPSVKQYETVARQAARVGKSFTVMLLDLDHFNDVNETCGIRAANEALQQVAEHLRACCRSADVPLRHSEDKFVVVCADTVTEAALPLADRIRQRLAETTIDAANGMSRQLTCSIGIADSQADGAEAELLLTLATQRVRQAKAAGRDRVVIGEGRVSEAG